VPPGNSSSHHTVRKRRSKGLRTFATGAPRPNRRARCMSTTPRKFRSHSAVRDLIPDEAEELLKGQGLQR